MSNAFAHAGARSSSFRRSFGLVKLRAPVILTLLLAIVLFPINAFACACGCGVFNVGADTILLSDSQSGLSVWFRYSYMDQNRNWERGSKALASDNDDKGINTDFYTVGGGYMLNED
jgi:hypothetical protein